MLTSGRPAKTRQAADWSVRVLGLLPEEVRQHVMVRIDGEERVVSRGHGRSGVVAENQLRSTARNHVRGRICRARDNPRHHRGVRDIEETVRGLRFPSHVILRPVFFMENLLAPYSLQGDRLSSALGPDTKLQMIAVDDIGWFGARAFTDARP